MGDVFVIVSVGFCEFVLGGYFVLAFVVAGFPDEAVLAEGGCDAAFVACEFDRADGAEIDDDDGCVFGFGAVCVGVFCCGSIVGFVDGIVADVSSAGGVGVVPAFDGVNVSFVSRCFTRVDFAYFVGWFFVRVLLFWCAGRVGYSVF